MTMSAGGADAGLSRETEQVFVLLLELSHPGIEPVRMALNNEPVVHNGDEYLAAHFETDLPQDTNRPARVRVRIANVDRRLAGFVREQLTEPARVKISVVLASSPDMIEAGPFEMTLRNVSMDAMYVEGDLQNEDYLNTAVPALRTTPELFPGMYS